MRRRRSCSRRRERSGPSHLRRLGRLPHCPPRSSPASAFLQRMMWDSTMTRSGSGWRSDWQPAGALSRLRSSTGCASPAGGSSCVSGGWLCSVSCCYHNSPPEPEPTRRLEVTRATPGLRALPAMPGSPAPEGRWAVATGGASPRSGRAQPVEWSAQHPPAPAGRRNRRSLDPLAPPGQEGERPASTGSASAGFPAPTLHPWLQPDAPPGRVQAVDQSASTHPPRRDYGRATTPFHRTPISATIALPARWG